MEKKTVMSNEELIKEAERLMIESGRAAKNRTRTRPDYIGKGIKYELDTGSELVEQIKRELPDKWNEWVSLTHEFLIRGKEYGMRPTFDRRSSDNNYCLNNIDFLTFDEHMEKDNIVSVTIYDSLEKSINQYRTMTEASDMLNCSVPTISRYCDSGTPFRNRYSIQAEGVNKSKNNNKAEGHQEMMAVINGFIDEFDDDGNLVRQVPAQLKGIVSFPKLEYRRQGV